MEVTLKACGGDRKANLEGIADRIDEVLSAPDTEGRYRLGARTAHELRGLAEQLRIIGDEWPAGQTVSDTSPHTKTATMTPEDQNQLDMIEAHALRFRQIARTPDRMTHLHIGPRTVSEIRDRADDLLAIARALQGAQRQQPTADPTRLARSCRRG